MEKDDLRERVKKFRCHNLPGQGLGMHMGTYYLVNDLWQEIERLSAESGSAGDALFDTRLNALKNLTEMYREQLAEIVRP